MATHLPIYFPLTIETRIIYQAVRKQGPMSNKNNPSNIAPLPPRLPVNERELDRAIILLGNRKQAELNTRCRQELELLIGAYPTKGEAALWKRVLRRAYREATDG